ncbi:ribosome silencing factor [Bartonella sp. DGB1]|uniref:ribosome silencing factor n=1 Tax=Bartonella sp. DGB1 TaxID=3239807 RepID=UPI003524486E
MTYNNSTENNNEKLLNKNNFFYKSDELKQYIIDVLEELKAENIVVFDIAERFSLADYIIIASGNSSRHINALAMFVIEKLKEKKILASVDGLESSNWIVIDAGVVIAHIFHPETREFYNLEKIWRITQ